jgi:hypothetical protein
MRLYVVIVENSYEPGGIHYWDNCCGRRSNNYWALSAQRFVAYAVSNLEMAKGKDVLTTDECPNL